MEKYIRLKVGNAKETVIEENRQGSVKGKAKVAVNTSHYLYTEDTIEERTVEKYTGLEVRNAREAEWLRERQGSIKGKAKVAVNTSHCLDREYNRIENSGEVYWNVSGECEEKVYCWKRIGNTTDETE